MLRSPRFLLGVAAASALVCAYYALAQAIDIPGSEWLRERWTSISRRGSVSGHKMTNPRPNGPTDMTVFGGLAALTLWRGLSNRKAQST